MTSTIRTLDQAVRHKMLLKVECTACKRSASVPASDVAKLVRFGHDIQTLPFQCRQCGARASKIMPFESDSVRTTAPHDEHNRQENSAMGRHKRMPKLDPISVTKFVAEAAAYHRSLIPYKRDTKPGTEHHRAIMALSAQIQQAIREISGDEPPWCKSGPSTYSGFAGPAKET